MKVLVGATVIAAGAAFAPPRIELNLDGVTAESHTELLENGDAFDNTLHVDSWKPQGTSDATNSLTLSNQEIHEGMPAPNTGVGGFAQTYNGESSSIYREHDLGLTNKVCADGEQTDCEDVAVQSRQDWTERCAAGMNPETATTICPLPVAQAYDHEDNSIDVRTRLFRVDVNGVTCTTDEVEVCECIENSEVVVNGGSAACENSEIDWSKRSTYLIKYDATDMAGNHAEQVVFALILDDTVAPVITICNGPDEPVEAATDWELCHDGEQMSAVDNIDGDLTSHIVYDLQFSEIYESTFVYRFHDGPWSQLHEAVDIREPGKYLMTVKVCDTAGVYGENSMDNCAVQAKAVTIHDGLAPEIYVHGSTDLTQECGIAYQEEGASAVDLLETENNGVDEAGIIIDVDITVCQHDPDSGACDSVDSVDTSATAEYTVMYNAEDHAQPSPNIAEEATRSVHVVDTTIPTITLNGGGGVEIHMSTDVDHDDHTDALLWSDMGVTCTDSCAGELDFESGDVGTGSEGTTNAKWVSCPNQKFEGSMPLGSDGTPWDVMEACEFDEHILGQYVRLYRCKDANDNAAWVTRTVEVQDDKKPVIHMMGPPGAETYDASNTVEYTDKGATCTDKVDGSLSHAVEVSGQVVHMNVPDTYTVRYDCQDSSGNQATSVERTIVVVDASCPEIQLNGDEMNYVEAGFPYVDAGATASDDLDGDISEHIWTDGDTISTAGLFVDATSCRQIREAYCHDDSACDTSGLETGDYFITTGTGAEGDKYTRIPVWCDFTGDVAYTYYTCNGEDQESPCHDGPHINHDGSSDTESLCSQFGLELATQPLSNAAQDKFGESYHGQLETDIYLCSTNDEAQVSTDELPHSLWVHDYHTEIKHAEAGEYIIYFHVEDAHQNKECTTPARTVIVRDTLAPVISLHLDDKLIHSSDAAGEAGTGISLTYNSQASDDGSYPSSAGQVRGGEVNPAGTVPADAENPGPYENPHLVDNVLLAKTTGQTGNSWLMGAAASAVTGLALLAYNQKKHTVVTIDV